MTDGDAWVDSLTDNLKAHYGAAARQAAQGMVATDDCCGPAVADCCASGAAASRNPYGADRYDATDLDALPPEAVAGSLGCANPVALADLEPGDDVLDLGSGGGIDVLLSARRVGPNGRAYGVDMTDGMLELARANQARGSVTNAEFLKGRIEDVPLPDRSVDVVVSNCVINLSVDKDAVFAEAFRVLRPGGRLAIADVIADREADPDPLADSAAWAGCTGGAITRNQYRLRLEAAGFADVEIVDSHAVADGFWSVFVRGRRPQG